MFKAKHFFKSNIGKTAHDALASKDVYALAEKEAFDISDTENEEILTSIAQKDENVALLKKSIDIALLKKAIVTVNGSQWNCLSQILHVKRDDITGKPIIENGEFVLRNDTQSVQTIKKKIAKLENILQSAKNHNVSAADEKMPEGNVAPPLTKDDLNTRDNYIDAIKIGIDQYKGKKDLELALRLMAALNDFKGDNTTPLTGVVAHLTSEAKIFGEKASKTLLFVYINKVHNQFCLDNNEKGNLLTISPTIFKDQIFPKLPLPDLKNLGQVSTFFHTIRVTEIRRGKMIHHIAHREYDKADKIIENAPDDKKENLKFTKFLYHVAFGQQPEAKVMAEANPDYLSQKRTVTDYSGRTFKNITAFQYALWALDRHMWTMLREIKDKDGNFVLSDDKAVNLLKALEEEPEQFSPHGSHYDSTELYNAYQTYNNGFNNWSSGERDSHWIKDIGGAQRNVPAHVAQEFLRRDRNFPITPGIFKEKNLPRDHKDWDNKFWFPLKVSGGLGASFSYWSGPFEARRKGGGRRRATCVTPPPRARSRHYLHDDRRLIELFKVRTEELAELKQTLDLSEQKVLSL